MTARQPFAQRDMTRAEFARALERNRFRSVMGIWFEDLDDGKTGRASYGAIMYATGSRRGKIARRATLAKLKAERKKRERLESLAKDSG
jgi:hypothetical protein